MRHSLAFLFEPMRSGKTIVSILRKLGLFYSSVNGTAVEKHMFGDNIEFYSKSFEYGEVVNGKIKKVVFESCTFGPCDFNGSLFDSCEFIDCKFTSCNLNLLKIPNCKFKSTQFLRCKMMAVDWPKAYWRGLDLGSSLEFKSCLLSSSSFFSLNLNKMIMENCKSHDVDFREGNFSRSNFSGTDFQGSLFQNTNLASANFEDAKNYDINIINNKVKNAKFDRFEAVRLLEVLGIKLIG